MTEEQAKARLAEVFIASEALKNATTAYIAANERWRRETAHLHDEMVRCADRCSKLGLDEYVPADVDLLRTDKHSDPI